MSLPEEIRNHPKAWLDEEPPSSAVVVTSRARFARNIAGFPFAPHAAPSVLSAVCSEVEQGFARSGALRELIQVDLGHATGIERAFLKEARLISREMESGGEFRAVYVGHDMKESVMVNEEDHLRLQCFEPGLQVHAALERAVDLDEQIGEVLEYARHQKLGYLTACPTNVGTGLRLSVMMHLPGLMLTRELEAAIKPLPNCGLTVRGFHGEHSDHTGDFFQVSNEVTLGRSVAEIERVLSEMVGHLIEKESEARSLLQRQDGVGVQDAVWRSYGTLTHARKIDTAEAMKLLSRIRLGIDQGLWTGITHEGLNRLVMDIQPGHLIFRHGATDDPEQRDVARASLIRRFFEEGGKHEKEN